MLQITGSAQPPAQPPALTQTSVLTAERIRGEFREMPGLVLTISQACRLWRLDAPSCNAVLETLIDSGFLCRRADGAYARPTDLAIRPRMAKAGPERLRAQGSGLREISRS